MPLRAQSVALLATGTTNAMAMVAVSTFHCFTTVMARTRTLAREEAANVTLMVSTNVALKTRWVITALAMAR